LNNFIIFCIHNQEYVIKDLRENWEGVISLYRNNGLSSYYGFWPLFSLMTIYCDRKEYLSRITSCGPSMSHISIENPFQAEKYYRVQQKECLQKKL
jgi:hypothetical protein